MSFISIYLYFEFDLFYLSLQIFLFSLRFSLSEIWLDVSYLVLFFQPGAKLLSLDSVFFYKLFILTFDVSSKM